MKEPKDLGVKIGTRRHVIFRQLAETTKVLIEAEKKALEANEEILKMCNKIIEEEKQKV